MIAFYHHIPSLIDPIAFHFGFINVYWYSLMWLCAFGVVYGLVQYRIKVEEGIYATSYIQDVFFNAFIGALVGGRIGYVFLYDFLYYIEHPLEIVSPYDFATQQWIGIYGMSFHGGLIGVVIALYILMRRDKMLVIQFLDFVVPAIPLGYFFGRLGNFINQELVGRSTDAMIGMYFNQDIFLRHPSQLYEAFGEGLLLFIIMWTLRNRIKKQGVLVLVYVIGYGGIRFVIEFFREPDAHIGYYFNFFTLGQILSGVMVVCGVSFLWIIYCKKKGYSHK